MKKFISATRKSFFDLYQALLWTFNFVRGGSHRALYVFLFTTTIIQVFLMATPYAIGKIIDGFTHQNYWMWFAVLVGLYFATVITRYIEGMTREYVMGDYWMRVEQKVFARILEYSEIVHKMNREEMNREKVERGIGSVIGAIELVMFDSIYLIVSAIVTLTLFIIGAPTIAAISLIGVSLQLIGILIMNQRMMNDGKEIHDKYYKPIGIHRGSRIDGYMRVRRSGAQKKEAVVNENITNTFIREDRKLWFWFLGANSWRETVSIITLLICIAYTLWKVSEGVLEPGILIPVSVWVGHLNNLVGDFSHSLRRLGRTVPKIVSLRETLEIKETIDYSTSIKQPSLPNGTAPAITIDDLSYHYPDAKPDDLVLRNVSFGIAPGERVAFVGESGCGKSTLLSLLLREDDVTNGSITIAGENLRNIDPIWLRQNTAVIPQDPYVFDGTARMNIEYAAGRELTDTDIQHLRDAAKLDFLFESGRKGFDTVLGERGIKLSGGQRQRILIAAALAQNASLFLIDEATSSLDTETEKQVTEALESLMDQGKTVIMIAHRLSTIKSCNKIIVMRPVTRTPKGDSQIEYIGSSFEDAYENSKIFKGLVEEQFDLDLMRKILN